MVHSIHIECTTYFANFHCFSDFADEVITENGLDPKACTGLGTDGENKMVGIHSGLQARLREKYPWIVHMKCCPHTVDNGAKEANKTMPTDLLKLVAESYNWFAHSKIRQEDYKELLKDVGFDTVAKILHQDEEGEICDIPNPPLKLISLSTTRWLSFADCTERIVIQVCQINIEAFTS